MHIRARRSAALSTPDSHYAHLISRSSPIFTRNSCDSPSMPKTMDRYCGCRARGRRMELVHDFRCWCTVLLIVAPAGRLPVSYARLRFVEMTITVGESTVVTRETSGEAACATRPGSLLSFGNRSRWASPTYVSHSLLRYSSSSGFFYYPLLDGYFVSRFFPRTSSFPQALRFSIGSFYWRNNGVAAYYDRRILQRMISIIMKYFRNFSWKRKLKKHCVPFSWIVFYILKLLFSL